MDNMEMGQDLTQPTPAPHRHLALLIVILIILVMGMVGWWYFGNPGSPSTNDNADTTISVPEVNKNSDLNSAGTFLSDSQIDSQLSTTDIDSALTN